MEKRHNVLSVKDPMIIVFTNAFYSFSRLLQLLLLGYFIFILMSAEPQKDNLIYCCTLALGTNAVIRALSKHQHDSIRELLGIRISCTIKGLVYHMVSTSSLE